MGQCGCTPEESFIKVGDKILIIEHYPRCNFCGQDGAIAIWELDESGLKTFSDMPEYKELIDKAPELSIWMGKNSNTENLIINPSDLEDTLLFYLDCAFERADLDFEDIDEKRYGQLKKRIIKEFVNSLKEGEN